MPLSVLLQVQKEKQALEREKSNLGLSAVTEETGSPPPAAPARQARPAGVTEERRAGSAWMAVHGPAIAWCLRAVR